MIRRVLVGAAFVAAVFGAPTAHAEGLTRYWAYWNGSDGAWSYATQGAGTTIPRDGDVEAWSFVVSEGMTDASGPPTLIPSDAWKQACGQVAPRAGEKAVAVLIDFGTADIAPAGETPPAPTTECAVVDASANGFQVLSAVANVRADGGFLCGINGFPREECAPTIDSLDSSAPVAVSTPVASEEAPSENGGTPWWTLGVLAVAALVGLILWRRRR